jgi:hypothetical protein
MSEPAGRQATDVGATQTILAEMWVELLEVDAVQPSDHLLELGGNSLIATMIANRIEVAWGFRPTMATMMSASLAELAEACERRGVGTGT